MESKQKLYSVKQFCEIVGIHRSSFYALVKQGYINPIRLGSRQKIAQDELDRILREGNGDR